MLDYSKDQTTRHRPRGRTTSACWSGPTLVFHATTTQRGGARVQSRLSFTPVAADTVRQFSETSSDGGRTWTTQYDFYYARKPRSASAP